jgi:hypothetical protein
MTCENERRQRCKRTCNASAFASLVDQVQEADTYQIAFNAAGLTSGVYFYRLRTGGFEKTEKMLLLQ